MNMHQKYSIILLRHGQSTWNQQDLFTGWEDSDLTSRGENEAKEAGKIMKSNNLTFDIAFTSLLRRAIKTLWIALNEIDQVWIPIHNCWKLNERHYGHLTGLNKIEMEKKFGAKVVKTWRKSYDYMPNPIDPESSQWSGYDSRYSFLKPGEIPEGESLKDTVVRVADFWKEFIVPNLIDNKKIIISAHGNSLRALIMHLEKITPEEIEDLDIPRASPIKIEFDANLEVNSRIFLR